MQILNGLPDSPKTEAKGALLVRVLGMRPRVPPSCSLMLIGLSLSQVYSCAGSNVSVYILTL